MHETYSIRVQPDTLIFSAAHFITFEGGQCEPLHGHNFLVGLELEAPLDENAYVLDFADLVAAGRTALERLDHRIILPTHNEWIDVTQTADSIEARFGERRWVFPSTDCVLLPIQNTTAELLARWIADRVAEALRERRTGLAIDSLAVTVDECGGRAAVFRRKWAGHSGASG